MLKRLFLVIAAAITLSACGNTKIDASSADALKTSIAEIKQTLSPEQQEEFDESTQLLMMDGMDVGAIMRAAFTEDKAAAESIAQDAMSKLDGMTADQIIAEAAKIREERRQREISQIESEIAELETELREMLRQKEAADKLQSEINKIEVSDTRLYWAEPSEFSFGSDVVLEVTVKNNLDQAVSRVYMTGTLTTPGRSVPWLTEDFNYKIAGGLEPGEQQSWKLRPDQFSGSWYSAPRDRNDTVFTVSVRNADDANEDEIFDIKFDEDEFERSSSRLESLRGSLETLKDKAA